jgi:hypothetical protein
MTDERLKKLLRTTLPPSAGEELVRDVWPRLASRLEQPPGWSYLDLGLAAAVCVALGAYPEWLWLLAYHL